MGGQSVGLQMFEKAHGFKTIIKKRKNIFFIVLRQIGAEFALLRFFSAKNGCILIETVLYFPKRYKNETGKEGKQCFAWFVIKAMRWHM